MTFIFPECTVEEICLILLVTKINLLGYLWHARGCGSGSKAGHPVIWRSVLWSPAPAACTSTCPWARLRTSKLLFHQCVHVNVFCSWWADGTLHAGQVNKTGKVLHKCSPFTGNTREISVTLNKVEETFFFFYLKDQGWASRACFWLELVQSETKTVYTLFFIQSRWDNKRQKRESGTNTEEEVQKNTHSDTQCSIVYDYFIYKIY